jgi:hypothetical protein
MEDESALRKQIPHRVNERHFRIWWFDVVLPLNVRA